MNALLEPSSLSAWFAFQGRTADISDGSEPARLDRGLEDVHDGERQLACGNLLMMRH